MGQKLMLGLFLVLIFADTSSLANAQCQLVPPPRPPNCMNLRAAPFITSATSQFGSDIEGSSTNHLGHMFATNYGNVSTRHQLGQLWPSQRIIYQDPITSTYFNGIRFVNETTAFVVDKRQRVLKLQLEIQDGQTVVNGSTVFCQNSSMIEPNDLTFSRSGTLFLSGQNWVPDANATDGDVWSCTPDGTATRLDVMGRTNGIELNPDETKLYVSESYTRAGTPYAQKIWVYNVNTTAGTISNKTLFVDFGPLDGSVIFDVDGMKTDVEGNLYVTRNGGGQVVVFNPAAEVIGRIYLNFPNPTNIELGGPNGTMAYIVGACPLAGGIGCVDVIELVTPGRSWSIIH